MFTEQTNITDDRTAGWVFYDGECPFCTGWARRIGARLVARGYRLAALQSLHAAQHLSIAPGRCPDEMKLWLPGGRVLGGVDAVLYLASEFPFARPLVLAAKWPLVHRLLDAGYRWVAEHRACAGGSCRVGHA